MDEEYDLSAIQYLVMTQFENVVIQSKSSELDCDGYYVERSRCLQDSGSGRLRVAPSLDTIQQVGHKFKITRSRECKAVPREFNCEPAGSLRGTAGCQAALAALEGWEARIRDSREFADKMLEAHEERRRRHEWWDTFDIESLLDNAEFIGKRFAIHRYMGRSPARVDSHDTVIAWAKVQQHCLRWWISDVETACPHERKWGCQSQLLIKDSEGVEQRIRDMDCFRIAYPLIYKREIDWGHWLHKTKRISTQIAFGEFVRPWETHVPPFFPFEAIQDFENPYSEICALANALVRELPGKLRPRFSPIENADDAIYYLDQIIDWCQRQMTDGFAIKSEDAKKVRRKSRAEYNALATEYLKSHPEAGPRELIDYLGCGTKTVYDLPAFKAVDAERKKGRLPKAPKVVSLTDEMASMVPDRDKELARLVREQRRDDRTVKVTARDRG